MGGRDFLYKSKIRVDKLLIKSGLCAEVKNGTERKGTTVTQNRTNDERLAAWPHALLVLASTSLVSLVRALD